MEQQQIFKKKPLKKSSLLLLNKNFANESEHILVETMFPGTKSNLKSLKCFNETVQHIFNDNILFELEHR